MKIRTLLSETDPEIPNLVNKSLYYKDNVLTVHFIGVLSMNMGSSISFHIVT